MGVRLLMPVLSATAVEAGLSSVLARLSVQGEVAHEEDIGERAVLDHLQSDGSRSAAPVFDYRSEEHTSELQSPCNLVCRLLLEKKKEHTVTISPLILLSH